MNESENLQLYQSLKEQYQKLQLAYTSEEIRLKSIIKRKQKSLSMSSVAFQSSFIQNYNSKNENKNKTLNNAFTISLSPEESKSQDSIQHNKFEIDHPITFSFVIRSEIEDFLLNLEKDSSKNDTETKSFFIGNEESDDYNYIVDIPLFTSLTTKGWPFSISKTYPKESITCGLLGGFHQGKTFILSQLCTLNCKSNSFEQHSRSLSFKYDGNNSVMYIDTKGSNLPYGCGNKKGRSEIFNDEYNLFKCKEQFIENYVLNESQVVIYLMGYASQFQIDKLNKIKRNLNTSMIVIHNLYMLSTKKEVDNYYREVLQPVFQLQKERMLNTTSQMIENDELQGYFFYETTENERVNSEDIDDEDEEKKRVYHLIFGNTENPEFNVFNQHTICFVKEYLAKLKTRAFNIEKSLRENIKNIINSYFKVTKNNVKVTDKDFIPNLVFNNTSKKIEFKEPYKMKLMVMDSIYLVKDYMTYLDEDESHFCVRINLPFEPKTKKAKMTLNEKNATIRIEGHFKPIEKENEDEYNVLNDTIHRYSQYKLKIKVPELNKTIINQYSYFEVENLKEIVIKYPLEKEDDEDEEDEDDFDDDEDLDDE